MYRLISIASAIIRQFYLPNPYVNIIGNESYADLFNILVGGLILHILSRVLTGCEYTKGIDNPSAGSFKYLKNYCYLIVLITVLGYFISNIILFIVLSVVLYICSCVLFSYLYNRN